MRGSWRPNRTANLLTPTLMTITAFLSRSPGLLNRGPGDPASLVHVPHSSIFSPTDLISNWPDPQLTCVPSYIIIWHPFLFMRASQFRTQSTRPRSRLYPDIPRPDTPVIYTGAFPILTAWPGWRSICNISSDDIHGILIVIHIWILFQVKNHHLLLAREHIWHKAFLMGYSMRLELEWPDEINKLETYTYITHM